MKTSLSYSTMNALINEPHTWINKINGLKTQSNRYMEEGKIAHRIIQDHLSGKKINPELAKKDLPTFSILEAKDFDERTQVKFDIDDKYYFNGFVDGLDIEEKRILEIKTGAPWSVSKFARLVQWKLYGVGLPYMEKIYLLNTPRNPEEWNQNNIILFSADYTTADNQEANKFILKAIDIIEHLQDQKLHFEGRSRWCYYPTCPFCSEPL